MTMSGACGGNCPNCKKGSSGIEYADLIGILSLLIGLENLTENQQQSEHSEQLIRRIDVDAANGRQARALLDELGQKFEEQNAMLREILKEVSKA